MADHAIVEQLLNLLLNFILVVMWIVIQPHIHRTVALQQSNRIGVVIPVPHEKSHDFDQPKK